jgi:predicted CopG family antitoxin
MPYKYTVKVSEEVYRKLEELRRKMNFESFNQVIKWLVDRVTLSDVHELREKGNPILSIGDGVTPCSAKRVGKSYFITCSDGSQAFVPEQHIDELVSRFNLIIKIES